jgi:hypothetical protein
MKVSVAATPVVPHPAIVRLLSANSRPSRATNERQVNTGKRSLIYRMLSGHNAPCTVRFDSFGLQKNGPCIESSGPMQPKSRLAIIDDGYYNNLLSERN